MNSRAINLVKDYFEGKRRDEVFHHTMNFVDYLNDNDKSSQVEYICRNWKTLFSEIWVMLGGSKKDVEFAYCGFAETNWVHLHRTPEEENYQIEAWIVLFKSELFYCSDRWSFSRLYRVNWIYGNILNLLNNQ